MKRRVLIVGGVAGGASCAARLPRLDEEAEIVMFDRGPFVSFANCGLPYFVGNVIAEQKKLLVASAELFRERFNIEVRTRHEATVIDRAARTITVRDLERGTSVRSTTTRWCSPRVPHHSVRCRLASTFRGSSLCDRRGAPFGHCRWVGDDSLRGHFSVVRPSRQRVRKEDTLSTRRGHRRPLHYLLTFIQHLAITWLVAVPLLLLGGFSRRRDRLIVGLAYGAGFYIAVNSLALPFAFGDPTPWELGFESIQAALFTWCMASRLRCLRHNRLAHSNKLTWRAVGGGEHLARVCSSLQLTPTKNGAKSSVGRPSRTLSQAEGHGFPFRL